MGACRRDWRSALSRNSLSRPARGYGVAALQKKAPKRLKRLSRAQNRTPRREAAALARTESSGFSGRASLTRLRRRRRSKRRGGVDDARVFALEMGERQSMHVLRRPALASEIDLVDRPTRVGDDEHLIAEVAGVPRGRLDRIRRQNAANAQASSRRVRRAGLRGRRRRRRCWRSCRSPFRRRAARRKA